MILVRLGVRNLMLHKLKALIIGLVLMLGTAFFVVGAAVVKTMDKNMASCLVNSIVGDVHIYSAKTKGAFYLLGDLDGFSAKIEPMLDFQRIADTIGAVKNVKAVVPMATKYYTRTSITSYLETTLVALRDAVRSSDKVKTAPLKRQIRRIVALIQKEAREAAPLSDEERDAEEEASRQRSLSRAASNEFWDEFDQDPLGSLEFLENDIGPLGLPERSVYLQYVGTDTALFRKSFDRFEIVNGSMIPPGRRGFLFSKWNYERRIKDRVARRLDQVKEKLDQGRRISRSLLCKQWIKKNVKQAEWLVFRLSENAVDGIGKEIRALMKSEEKDLNKLMSAFLNMDDSNFSRRYELFYKVVAPAYSLYSVPVGSTLVLTGVTSGGFIKRVPVKVYGVYKFRGLGKNQIGGAFNVLDLMTYRDIYGYLNIERKQELATIIKKGGVQTVSQEEAEAMFSSGDLLKERSEADEAALVASEQAPTAAASQPASNIKARIARLFERTYTKKEINSGVVFNAAILFEDPGQRASTIAAIRQTIKKHRLNVKLAGWRQVSGRVGMALSEFRKVLNLIVIIIFFVMMIIISNALLMSAMERTTEIGTMRALGAQRGFVIRMLLFENLVLAAVFAGLGIAAGVGLTHWLGAKGIPAVNDSLYVVFSGPRLHPEFFPETITNSLIAVVVVVVGATFFPARMATRIPPRVAMSKED